MALKKHTASMEDLLRALTEDFSPSDLLAGKIQAEVSTAIVSERIERGLSQHQFAEILKVGQSQVSKWESDDCNFTIKTLAHIATSLDMNLTISLKKAPALISGHTKSCKFYSFPSGERRTWQSLSSSRANEDDYELEEM